MPTLSVFYGILIRMYGFDNSRHSEPHIHARFAEHEVVLRISDSAVLAGSLPPRKLVMVEAWMEIHRQELWDAWALMINGENPGKISPLQ